MKNLLKKFLSCFMNHKKIPSISFLFGAGISKPSGLPLAKDLTDAILDNNEASIEQHHLNIINYIKDSLKTDNYEDIYSVAKSLLLYCDDIYKNPAATIYLNKLREKIKNESTYGIENTCNAICNYIDKVVCEKLKINPNNIKGLDLLTQISENKSFKTVNIFTLNHDTILETILPDKFSDGFKKLEEGIYIFSNEWDNKKFRLHKLHGGIDWCPLYSNEQKKYIPGRFDLFREKMDIKSSYSKYGYEYQEDYAKILTGTAIKEFEYNFGIYVDLFNLFFSRLNESTRLFVSGYGWKDSAINLRVLDWLHRSPENKLILMHNNKETPIPKFANEKITEAAWEGKVSFLNKWLSEATIDDIKNHL